MKAGEDEVFAKVKELYREPNLVLLSTYSKSLPVPNKTITN